MRKYSIGNLPQKNKETSIFMRGDHGGSVWKIWGKETVHSPLSQRQDANETSINADIKSSQKQEDEELENVSPALSLDETEQIDELESVCLSNIIGYFQTKSFSNRKC